MSIKIRYFASLKERIGRSEDNVICRPGSTVEQIWLQANAGMPMPDNLLAAVNMDYVGFDHVVSDGDEIAFFPPVTGG